MRRTQVSGSDAAVRATNDDAFVSKVSASRKGYFDDEFLGELSRHLSLQHTPTRPPLINRGTAARVLFKNAIVSEFLSAVSRRGFRSVQILSLGAGFDSLPFSLLSGTGVESSTGVHIVELDFPEVVSGKAQVVRDVPVFRVLFDDLRRTQGDGLDGVKNVADGLESRYTLQSCDLRDIAGLQRTLQAVGLQPKIPTLVLAEIVLIYMEPDASDAVLEAVATYFSTTSLFLNIEHIGPNDAFGKQMVLNIAMRGSPLLGINRYPTTSTQKDRFIGAGWPHVRALTMLDAFKKRFSRDESIRLNKIELLDEIEEWSILMEHYCIVIAAADWGGTGGQLLDEVVLRGLSKPVTKKELPTRGSAG